ncbi:hypothetical protein RSK20926_12274 [Roseobacter sp. SK209-2-6]|uniref:DUF484 family protein n=1 Tax=Roseobacter sp. SK209-2-6 TaxID=388739 RepID=UPI0000F3C819|nr:DUF484 family protein [Roseobacter sp. SK209-2-6]EBA18496.1 hypothetical protein RSK20926_12274 [Roseobacter sp. SK209-2-6]
MSSAKLDTSLRDAILAEPDALLEDQGLMKVLVAASERAMGSNIIDMRGIAMDRMEARLDRLEDVYRSVVATAYENLTGTKQIHRAVLRLLEPTDFESFLEALKSDLAEKLNVEVIALVLESAQDGSGSAAAKRDDVLKLVGPGFTESYAMSERGSDKQVTLRQLQGGSPTIYGDKAEWIRSEACLRLDLGEGRLPGLLVLGSEDPHQFTPQHGVDLLTFFAGVFERSMRRWLS